MKRKKIGIFTGYFLPHTGGVERYVDKLSVALSKLGYDIVIVTSNHDDGVSYEQGPSRKIYRLPIAKFAKQRYPIPRINVRYRELIRNIEAEKIDYFIVNTRFHLTSLIGARIGRRQKAPVLLVEHGTAHFSVNNKILDALGLVYEHILTTIIKKYVDAFYGVSQSCNVWAQHFGIRAAGVFYNAVNKRDRENVSDYYSKKYKSDEIVISFAGRLIKEKGVINLLEAFTKLQTTKKVRLVIAGPGDLYEHIKKKYTHKNIDIVGKLDFEHVMSLYKRSDVFVYPSLYPEGLPTSILEAGLMECAVIATPRGGTEEIIIDNTHGTIIDGSIQSLVAALSEIINDDKKRLKQAKKIRTRVERYFDWDAVAKIVDREIKGFAVNKS
ncbi:MAG: glycosyltransferase family 4 protein [Candidatus Microsaccharimonas sp.]